MNPKKKKVEAKPTSREHNCLGARVFGYSIYIIKINITNCQTKGNQSNKHLKLPATMYHA